MPRIDSRSSTEHAGAAACAGERFDTVHSAPPFVEGDRSAGGISFARRHCRGDGAPGPGIAGQAGQGTRRPGDIAPRWASSGGSSSPGAGETSSRAGRRLARMRAAWASAPGRCAVAVLPTGRSLAARAVLAIPLVLALACLRVAFAQDPAPQVSIAASEVPVAEGDAATFVLTLDTETAAALTVTVTVTETGSMLSDASSQSVTFSIGTTSATLDVATELDTVAESDSWVTATVAAGTGYTVGAQTSATVHVEDASTATRPVITLSCYDSTFQEDGSYGRYDSDAGFWVMAAEIEVSELVPVLVPAESVVVSPPTGHPLDVLVIQNRHPGGYTELSVGFYAKDVTGESTVGSSQAPRETSRASIAGLPNRSMLPRTARFRSQTRASRRELERQSTSWWRSIRGTTARRQR